MKLVSFYSCCVVVNKKLSIFENIETFTSFCIYLNLSSIPLLWAQFLYLHCLCHLALFQGLLLLSSILHSPVIWYVQIPILHLNMACLCVAFWTFIPLLVPNRSRCGKIKTTVLSQNFHMYFQIKQTYQWRKCEPQFMLLNTIKKADSEWLRENSLQSRYVITK